MRHLLKSLLILSFLFSPAAMAEKIAPAQGTEIVFVLDRSGSMAGLESDTIGGFNAMLDKQKAENSDQAYITTVLFDDKYELLHNRQPLEQVKPLTKKTYFVRGGTALLDAVGKTIQTLKQRGASKVLFVIITDGEENSSHEFKLETIKRLISEQTKAGWEFLFLGANIDAISAAGNIGIAADKAVKYHADGEGTQKNYEAVSEVAKSVRKGDKVDSQWKKEIEEDQKKKEGK